MYILNTTLCDTVCQLPATGRWFSPSTLVSSSHRVYQNCNDTTLYDTVCQ